MKILGINYPTYMASACLMEDCKILHAVAEERLTGKKNDDNFPLNSIKQCLKETRSQFEEIDYISINWDPFNGLLKRFFYLLLNDYKTLFSLNGSQGRPNFSTWSKIYFLEKKFHENFGYSREFFKRKIVYNNHHMCHIDSSFFYSGFDEALTISVDGAGEIETIKLGYYDVNKKFKLIKNFYFPHSLGFLYSAFTQFLGFETENHEYKVMGMAAFGKKYLRREMDSIVTTDKKNFFKINMKYFSYDKQTITDEYGNQLFFNKNFESIFGKHRLKNQKLTQHHFDIAMSLQTKFEEILNSIVNYGLSVSNSQNLCISGGCALNGLANGKFLNNSKIKKIFIPSWANDAGGSIGSATRTFIKKEKLNFYKINSSDFLGRDYSDKYILESSKKFNINLKFSDDIFLEASKFLNKQKVIIWFQGRMEFGPRALGNRSFLADPRNLEIKDKINSIIKKREMFRPFAPVVISNDIAKYFISKNNYSPFMNIVFKVKPKFISKFKAIVHKDKTARVQTVSKKSNFKLWKLLTTYKKISGHGILLNTSLNLKEQPIVQSPELAFEIFKNSNVDGIFINNYFCVKGD